MFFNNGKWLKNLNMHPIILPSFYIALNSCLPAVEEKIIVYLDDNLVFMETLGEHQEVVKKVVYLLHIHNLFLKPEKCKFEHTEIEYLRVIISHNSVHMDPVKVARVAKWPVPSNKKEVQLFLGFANFY
jgi:hypothetical protein